MSKRKISEEELPYLRMRDARKRAIRHYVNQLFLHLNQPELDVRVLSRRSKVEIDDMRQVMQTASKEIKQRLASYQDHQLTDEQVDDVREKLYMDPSQLGITLPEKQDMIEFNTRVSGATSAEEFCLLAIDAAYDVESFSMMMREVLNPTAEVYQRYEVSFWGELCAHWGVKPEHFEDFSS